MQARVRRESEVDITAREGTRHETSWICIRESACKIEAWLSAPRSSLASPGISPRRMESNVRISAA